MMTGFIETHLKLLEEKLDQLIQEKPFMYHNPLFQAARYSVFSSGKRLRPLLLLATTAAYEVPLEKSIIPACALEMVHTYSLIHDDLPCMDDDDYRRGKPSLHKVYPEGHALLTGNFLLTYAFQLLCESPLLTDKQKLKLINVLAKSAGSEGMIGGQVVDIASEGKKIDWETLEFMHLGKTASLIIASLELGGIIGEAPKKDMLALHTAGKYLGLAFQIQDDLDDVKEKKGSDAKKQKATALSLLEPEKSKFLAGQFFSLAFKSLDNLSQPAPLLQEMARSLIKS
ncbi:MAG TPA: farnesyl diphosphate synthase [Rhabdochlamydiaceae bacterium]|nr:farnesyl diphosphate synthase [Rhabdochlamydiaceae bacterium]